MITVFFLLKNHFTHSCPVIEFQTFLSNRFILSYGIKVYPTTAISPLLATNL